MAARDDAGVTLGVQVDSRPIGYITVADDVRPHAHEDVARLRADGVEPVLVSEDSERNTRGLAEACGIAQWYADHPADTRAALVEKILARRSTKFYMFDWNGVALDRHTYVEMPDPFETYEDVAK